MKIPVECIARQVGEDVVRLSFAARVGSVVDLTLTMTVHTDAGLEPDPYAIKVGDKHMIELDPSKGWPPLE